jgi:hypothetical protein
MRLAEDLNQLPGYSVFDSLVGLEVIQSHQMSQIFDSRLARIYSTLPRYLVRDGAARAASSTPRWRAI